MGKTWDTLSYDDTMPDYRRVYIPGATVFLTLVTYQRRAIFAEPDNIRRLRRAIADVKAEMPFAITAAVVLPDHLHFVWTLPPDDAQYSKRVGRLKVLFTRSFKGKESLPQDVCVSRRRQRESDVWQRRFWEHTIRDEDDWIRHLNYLHYNPVKHRLVQCPHQWEFSSFRQFAANGFYDKDWGCCCRGKSRESFKGEDLVVGE